MMRTRQARAIARAWYVLGGFAGTMAGSPLYAQDSVPRRLPAVQVTRDKERSPLELPFAISAIRPDSVSPGQPHTMPEQTLFLLPGVTVANRNNPSQDARISIRGFGARSQFGVRSLKVLRDGMPLTMPDGQTPIDYLDLESVGRVETIRGSSSSLYGNASGGVIDLRSGPPPSDPIASELRTWAGSNNSRRNTLLVGGTRGATSYTASIGRTQSDGMRGYANQRLTNAFLRASTEILGTDVSLIGMGLDMPIAQNPGALTRIQFDTNPEMADPTSVVRKARKEVHQVQIGLQARRPLLGGELNAQLHGGGRSLYNPLIPNVVGVDRHTGGGSVRANIPVRGRQRITVGFDAQRLSDARKNWVTCNTTPVPASCTTPGDRGALTVDQREIVTNVGPYVRDEFDLGRAHATLGVRADRTVYTTTDHLTSDGRDDSGSRTMSAVSPMAGIALKVRDQQSVYVNISTAFETPTTNEMGNKPDSTAGLNPALNPQVSLTAEVGAKGHALGLAYDVALYATRVKDEIIGFDIGGGRNAFRNVGRTRRRGAEGSLATDVGPVALNATYTYSDFTFVSFVSGTTVVDGNAIPGIPKNQIQFSAVYRHRYGFALVEWLAKDKIYVNDANVASAPGYAVVNVRAGGRASLGKRWLAPVFGVQNLLDRKYVASVAVNAAIPAPGGVPNPSLAKFYEPGPGRTWYVGLTAATAPW